MLLAVPAALGAPNQTHADREIIEEIVEEVVVWGRALDQKGTAVSASSGLVGYSDFEFRPLQRVGELVEVVPGMVAAQHSGEGKANQYFLRGMNLDHGTDFSAYFEGMPINLRAHAHGQGYLDMNFLIPEVVSSVRYAKGPYSADRGDFSSAGTGSFAVYDRLPEHFVELTGGEDAYRRVVAAGSVDVAGGHLLAAVEAVDNDGPWDLPADLRKRNLLLKYRNDGERFDTSLVLSVYDNEWTATDQVPARWVDQGLGDRFSFIDPALGGESSRVSAIAGVSSERLRATAYVSHYELDLYGNFTYFLEDPVNGDQVLQVDRRWVYGGSVDFSYDTGTGSVLRIGGDLRYDGIGAADLYATTGRVRRYGIRQDDIDWLSAGAFGELATFWTDRLRTVVGLRVDHYDYEVNALRSVNSGSDSEQQLLPSVSFAYQLNDSVEAYANWGRGFHSNDVRGVVIEVDPMSGEPAESVALYVDQTGYEFGLRVEGWQGLNATLTWFYLESDSDLLFVGDSGATEPAAGSERAGVEVSAFWQLGDHWTFDVNASFVDSEFVGVPRNEDHIPNAHGRVIGAGITYVGSNGFNGSLRMRHFGDAPLVEDDSVRQGSTTVYNMSIGYEVGSWSFGAELLNVFDAEDNDIAYWFESRLPGEAAAVEDVHFHPVQPRSVRFSVRRRFG